MTAEELLEEAADLIEALTCGNSERRRAEGPDWLARYRVWWLEKEREKTLVLVETMRECVALREQAKGAR